MKDHTTKPLRPLRTHSVTLCTADNSTRLWAEAQELQVTFQRDTYMRKQPVIIRYICVIHLLRYCVDAMGKIRLKEQGGTSEGQA